MRDDLTPHLKVVDAAENMLIAYGMGWDMEGTIEVFDNACKEFRAPDDSGNSRSDDVKLYEQVIKSAMAMRLNIKFGFSREQIADEAKDLGLRIDAIEHLRTREAAPTAP